MSEPLRFGVVGWPVAHSRSPAMHEAAYRALGMPHTYEKLETSEAALAGRVASLRSGLYAGLNVTIPHKTRVLSLVDEIDASAVATGAANTLVRTAAGGVRAYNTDAPALEAELAGLAGLAALAGAPGAPGALFAGRRAIVLGTGGAARAAIFALGRLGVARVHVRGRSRREELAAILPPGAVVLEELAAPPAEASDLVAIVQATSAGMGQEGANERSVSEAVAWSSVPPTAVAYDVVYASSAPETAFVARARAAGLAASGGLGMLVRQGALAFELWLGVEAPLSTMRAALGMER